MTREEAIKTLKGEAWICCQEKWQEALNMAIKALEQEPFINKPCVSEGVCREDNIQVLNKIRAEIEQIAKDYDKFNDYRRVRGLWIALEIIDKCKAESEDKE